MTEVLDRFGWRLHPIVDWDRDDGDDRELVLVPERWDDAGIAAALSDGLAIATPDGLSLRAGMETVSATIAEWAVAGDALPAEQESVFAARLGYLLASGAVRLERPLIALALHGAGNAAYSACCIAWPSGGEPEAGAVTTAHRILAGGAALVIEGAPSPDAMDALEALARLLGHGPSAISVCVATSTSPLPARAMNRARLATAARHGGRTLDADLAAIAAARGGPSALRNAGRARRHGVHDADVAAALTGAWDSRYGEALSDEVDHLARSALVSAPFDAAGALDRAACPVDASGACAFAGPGACIAAALDVSAFVADGALDAAGLERATEDLVVALEAAHWASMAPSQAIAEGVSDTRALAIRVEGIAPALMACGIAYASPEGAASAASVAALVSGAAVVTSGALAESLGMCTAWSDNPAPRQARLRKAAQAAASMNPPPPFATVGVRAAKIWQGAAALQGLRHAALIAIAPALHGAFAGGCDPVSEIAPFATLTDGGVGRRLSAAAALGLRSLGYAPGDILAIAAHAEGRRTLAGAPQLSLEDLARRGLPNASVEAIDAAVRIGFPVRSAIHPAIVGTDALGLRLV